jgi:hypothetical protein
MLAEVLFVGAVAAGGGVLTWLGASWLYATVRRREKKRREEQELAREMNEGQGEETNAWP